MNKMTFVMIMGMMLLPLAGLIIVVVCIAGDIRSHREMKRFEKAISLCEKEHDWSFTNRLLDKCAHYNLPVISQIELLEYFAKFKRSKTKS